MTDQELGRRLAEAQAFERQLKAETATEDLAERDQALVAYRLAVPLRRALETWLSLRTMRRTLAGSRQ